MDSLTVIAVVSIISAGGTMALGALAPAISEGWLAKQAVSAIAQQPDAQNTIMRTLFVSLAMIESIAIYCFVISIILIFANPFWSFVAK
jgi:F-type H+-transporting ATPase subunit c